VPIGKSGAHGSKCWCGGNQPGFDRQGGPLGPGAYLPPGRGRNNLKFMRSIVVTEDFEDHGEFGSIQQRSPW
jgi:hypothetical protein